MVVLAVSITTRSGKPLLSRQFRDISKDRVTELLSNFQGLVANSSSQHTFVEDEHVRYVYKPFDDYYIILITNRQSNIIQDLDTLNLFSQTVNSSLRSFDENEIFENAFEILGSFDEIIAMGYKENLSLTQINNFLSMESHEEKIQEIIERNKEFEAAEERKRRAKEITRREQERRMGLPPSNMDMYGQHKFGASNDPNVSNAYNSYYSHASPAAQQSYLHSQQQSQNVEGHVTSPSPIASSPAVGGRGMKLGGKKGLASSASQFQAPRTSASRRAVSYQEQDQEEKPTNNGILISIKETINAELTRDGTISTSELKGVLELRVNNPDLAHAKIALDSKVDAKDRSYQYKTHPNIDKNLFTSSKVIGLRDSTKAFPSNDQSLGVLRWRKVGTADDNSLIPLEVSTWVSPSSSNEGMFDVTVEFEVNPDYDQELKDLRFAVPVFTENVYINDENNESGASIKEIDEEQGVIIGVDSIAPGNSGVFGFVVEAGFEDALFPMTVAFKNTNVSSTFSGISVASVTSATEEGQELPFEAISTLKTDQYVVI